MFEDDAPAATPENVDETPGLATPDTVDAGTTEPVAETDEAKAERLVKERQIRQQRAQQKINARFSEMSEGIRAKDRQIEQLTTALVGKQHAPQNDATGEPKREQFESWEDWNDARVDWRAEARATKVFAEAEQRRADQAREHGVHSQAQDIAQRFAQRQSEFVKQFPDYTDVVLNNDDVEVPESVLGLIPIIPDGHVAAYAIAKNPELARQLYGKSPVQQAAMLGQMAAAFKARSPQVSTAPAPGKPVATRASAASHELSDTDSTSAWLKKRNADVNKRLT